MHSISDLTTFCRKTTGDVPARLVGASTTVVGSKLYLFGGRLVTERRMVSDMYMFDLETFNWEKLSTFPEDNVPPARYFHSADTWNNQLVIFGGMGNKFSSSTSEDLCVLNDVRFFDLTTKHWIPPSSPSGAPSDVPSDVLLPKARYAHLSSITSDRLFIIGGQDLANVWLDDIYIYDLLGKAWVQRRDYPRHCGTYRSVAVSSSMRVRIPQNETRGAQSSSSLGPPGSRFKADKNASSTPEFTSPDTLTSLPYSATPTDDYPNDIYLYSNYNFTDVKRELEVFSPLPDMDFTISDRSSTMTGTSFPPGLRFPTGAILGTHLIIAGTYLAHTYQSFSIWALDLQNMTWSRIDPGSAVSTGSWFRGCLWAEANKFLIFGNRNGNLVEDYNRRLLSWDHAAVIDLEAFGIYQPPTLEVDARMQEIGLSALEEGVFTDFEIVCEDGRKIRCSRKVLEDRWPWFKEQCQKFVQMARYTADGMPASMMHVGLPELPGVSSIESRPDPRLTPRSFNLSEPYPITLALLQYFYSMALLTPLQHAPAVLSQLLILSNVYQITHLETLVKHAMHRALSNATSVGVYEVATLCSCRSLQIRALKTVMAYSQRRTGRTRDDRDGGSGGRRPDPNGGSGSGGAGGPPRASVTARPRGTSDAHFRGASAQNGDAGPVRGYTSQFSAEDRNIQPSESKSTTLETLSSSITLLPYKSSTPLFLHRRPSMPQLRIHNRTSSTVSTTTDHELCEVAELMSPVIVAPYHAVAEEQEQTGIAIADDEFDSIVERYDWSGAPRRASVTSEAYLHISSELSTPLSPAPTTPSLYAESELEQSSSDDHDRSQITYPAFHLPRPRRISRDSDTPSLIASTASSSSLSVSQWAQRRVSPPSSPVLLHTPIDTPHNGVPSHLDIIEERSPEDQELSFSEMQCRPSISTIDSGDSAITFAPLNHISSPTRTESPTSIKPLASVQYKRPMPHVENLRLSTKILIEDNAHSNSSFLSTDSDATPSEPRKLPYLKSYRSSSALSLVRFLSPSKSRLKTQPSMDSVNWNKSQVNGRADTLHEKASKAEMKKRKKAEAQEKTEKLAMELKQSFPRDRLRLNWDNQPALFGGMSNLAL